jgi:hypothetical protein
LAALPGQRERLIRQAFQRAFLGPASLGLTAAALVLATQPVTWLPAGLVAGLELVWIFLQVRNPAYIRQVADERHRTHWRHSLARAEDLQRVLDPSTGAVLANLIGAQERLLALSSEAQGLVPSRSQAADLLAHCLQLVEKRLQLEGFINESRAADLQREADELLARAAATPDPVAKQLFEQALSQKRSEINNLDAIQNAIARIDGQLAAVDATFDNLVGNIVRLRTTAASAERLDEQYVLEELDHLTRGVAAVEASVTEMLALRGRA